MLARNGTLLGLALLISVFTIANDNFFSWANAKNIEQALSALVIVSIPLPLHVISGAVDLSVGSVASLAGIIAGMVMATTASTPLGILAGLAVGIGTGAINGVLVSYFNLNSSVVTLGGLSVWGGMALYLTGGQTVAGLPDSFVDLANIEIFGISIEIFVL